MTFKDSGIEWLGEIPEHWEVVKIKHIAKKLIGGGTPDTSISDYWGSDKSNSYLWVSIEDITKSSFIRDTSRRITQKGLEASSAKIIPPFSILYSIYASLGKIAYSDLPVTTNQAILAIQPKKEIFYKFLFYILHSTTKNIIMLSSTTTQNNISLLIVQNLKIPLPPLEEQKAIADFLDSKCKQIESFVDKKQKLITLLNEKKQALINKCVTKGLNKNVKYKDSGIEHLGAIPTHWEILKLKYVALTNIGLVYTPDDIVENSDKGYPLLRANNIQNGKIDYQDLIYIKSEQIEKKQIASIGDLLMCVRNGSENLLGKTAKIQDGYFSFGAFTAIIKSQFNDYFYWIFQTNMLRKSIASFSVSNGIGQISQEDIKNFIIPFPPLQEQKQIAQFLDSEISKIDSIIEKIKKTNRAYQRIQKRPYKPSCMW
ncbi:restriction endonuclease subunit S [Helicobacter pullorum]